MTGVSVSGFVGDRVLTDMSVSLTHCFSVPFSVVSRHSSDDSGHIQICASLGRVMFY